MSIPQVGQGAVAVVPTFKGFRKATDAEMAGSVRSAGNIFSNGFRSIGSNSGRGFKTSFDSASKGLAAGALKTLQSDVAKFSREVSAARLKEQDATGKLRVAEAQLAEARRRYASDSSQVIRAEERLASLQRNALGTKASLIGSTDKLAAAQKRLATATAQASTDGVRQGGIFSRLSNLFESSGSDSASRFGNGFRTTFGAIFSGSFLADLAARAAFGAGQAVGAVIRSGFDYGMQGITLASDLEQSTGAIEAVFKDQVDIILDSARAAATEVGLTRAQFQSFATVVGSQLKNLGLPFDQVSGKTIDLIELGADLAAQFGGSTYDAVGALSSLLRGERDPIERYGVGLKQVDIDARKAALGMSELEGEADKQATIVATLALLWEQTADAQGTFAREADTYAGKQQRLNAQLAESQTRLGEALLPSATDALQFANDDLLPVLESTIATVGPQLAQTLRDSAPEIKEAITAIASTIPDAIDLAGKVLPVISASIEGDVRFLEDGQKTFDRTNQFFTEYLPRWAEGSVTVQESWEGFFNWWDLAWDGTADTVENKSDEIKDYWADTLAGMKAQAQQASLASEGVAFAQGFADGITSNEEAAILAAERMALAARDKVKNTMLIESPSRVMRELGRFVPEGFALGINDGVPFIDRAAERMATAASNVAAVTGGGSRSGGASGGPLVGELRVETHQGMSEQQVADLAIARLQFVLRGR